MSVSVAPEIVTPNRIEMRRKIKLRTPDVIPPPEPLGQWGWLTRWPDEASAAAWADFARSLNWPCAVEIVPAYRTVASIGVERLSQDQHHSMLASIMEAIARFPEIDSGVSRMTAQRPVVEVPVVYDGPDLAEVASLANLEPRMVVDLHTSVDYQVFAVGFQPGFPYAGFLPEAISGLPRRSSPRAKVRAGSVAIAGRQTGIYPRESPGGWHILGHTTMMICDMTRGFFRFQPGDRIRFVAQQGGITPRTTQDENEPTGEHGKRGS